jgi:phosphohistidine phosphatase
MSNPNRLILIRHGRAESGVSDRERKLTPLGQQEILNIARRIKETNWYVNQIVHSDYERTKVTATLLSRILQPTAGIDIMQGITPDSDALSIRHELDSANNLLIVSHLPFLDELVYEFIQPKREDEFIHFMPGTAIGLQKETRWALAWHIQP